MTEVETASAADPVPHGISPQALYEGLSSRGIEFFTGVPCSYFGGLLRLLSERCPDRYIPAANEGTAFATACGLTMAGRSAMVLIQNSGLGNLVNPVTSLGMTFSIPVLILLSHRGDPAGPPDEPQHRVMGSATARVLDTIGLRWWQMPAREDELGAVLDVSAAELADGRSAVIIVRRGGIGAWPDGPQPGATTVPCVDPMLALRAIGEQLTNEIVVSTTGYLSRRLFASFDRPSNFYVQGSMGHASSVALGTALGQPRRRVVVLDGDGACVMHMGALSTIGAAAPPNLTHLVMDNASYESTGGQPTTSASTRLDQVALACGYRTAAEVSTGEELPEKVKIALLSPGPALLMIRTSAGSGPAPPRATATIGPDQLRARFEDAIRRQPSESKR